MQNESATVNVVDNELKRKFVYRSRSLVICDHEAVKNVSNILQIYNIALINNCTFLKAQKLANTRIENKFSREDIDKYLRKDRKSGKKISSVIRIRIKDSAEKIKIPVINFEINKDRLRIKNNEKVICGSIGLYKGKNGNYVKVNIVFKKLCTTNKEESCGIDFGIYKIAVNGKIYDLFYLKNLIRRIKVLREKAKTDKNRNVRRYLKKAKDKLINTVTDSYRKISKEITSTYGNIGIEKIQENGSRKGFVFLYKKFLKELTRKAAENGAKVHIVSNHLNSKICNKCRNKLTDLPKEGKAICTKCCKILDRDANASLNVLDKTIGKVRERGYSEECPQGNQTAGIIRLKCLSLPTGARRITSAANRWEESKKKNCFKPPTLKKVLHLFFKLDEILNFSGTGGSCFKSIRSATRKIKNLDKDYLETIKAAFNLFLNTVAQSA